jgi:hypothetical protein
MTNVLRNVGIGLTAAGLAGIAIFMVAPTSPEPSCRSLVLEKANKLTQKMIMPNGDGGVFLLSQGSEPQQIVFFGYVGPTTATTLLNDMLEVGLTGVSVQSSGQCTAENGLVYTTVYGKYKVREQPQPEPEPI